jgi:hypothetical protein
MNHSYLMRQCCGRSCVKVSDGEKRSMTHTMKIGDEKEQQHQCVLKTLNDTPLTALSLRNYNP